MRSFPLKIWRSKPGEIGPDRHWCATYSCYLHIEDSLFGLLWNLVTEWEDDRHLVG